MSAILRLPYTVWDWTRPVHGFKKEKDLHDQFQRAIKECSMSRLAREIHYTVENFPEDKGWEVLEAAFHEIAPEKHVELREALAPLLRLEKIEAILKAKHPNYAGLEVLLEGDTDPDQIPIEASVGAHDAESFTAFVQKFPRFLHQLVRPMTEAFSRARTIFPESIWESFLVLQVYTKILMIPYLIFQVAMLLIAPVWAALLVGGVVVVAALAAITIYITFFRGPPDRLPLAENFSYKASAIIVGRNQEMEEMIHHLTHADRKCVFVVAPSGTGKTLLVESLAPKLKQKGMDLHKYDPGALGSKGSAFKDGSIADDIERIVDGYEKNVVHYFDELSQIGSLSRLQRLIDKGHQIIVSTTPEDLEAAKKAVSTWTTFDNRSVTIGLQPLTEAELFDVLSAHAAALPIEASMLRTLIEQCKEAKMTEPAFVIQALYESIRLVEEQWKPPQDLAEKVRKERQKQDRVRYTEPWNVAPLSGKEDFKEQMSRWQEGAALYEHLLSLRKQWVVEVKRRRDMAAMCRSQKSKIDYIIQTCFIIPLLMKRIQKEEQALTNKNFAPSVTTEMIQRSIERKLADRRQNLDKLS